MSPGLLIVLLLAGSTKGEAAGGGRCASFTCADFSHQKLVIKEDVTEDPFCVISEDMEVGQSIHCKSKAINVTMLSPSHLLLRSPGTIHSPLLLEYGKAYELGELCWSEDEACPTPCPPTSTSPSNTPKTPPMIISVVCVALPLVVLAVLGGICACRRVRKCKYTPTPKEDPSPGANSAV